MRVTRNKVGTAAVDDAPSSVRHVLPRTHQAGRHHLDQGSRSAEGIEDSYVALHCATPFGMCDDRDEVGRLQTRKHGKRKPGRRRTRHLDEDEAIRDATPTQLAEWLRHGREWAELCSDGQLDANSAKGKRACEPFAGEDSLTMVRRKSLRTVRSAQDVLDAGLDEPCRHRRGGRESCRAVIHAGQYMCVSVDHEIFRRACAILKSRNLMSGSEVASEDC
jgi:hypothetical protein